MATTFGDRSRVAGKSAGANPIAARRARALRADAAVRLIVVHAISPTAEAFYLNHGFTRLPVDTRTYALDLVKLENRRCPK
jgi:hypothetical protein